MVGELPFGHLHAISRDVKSRMQPGDDLWSFSTGGMTTEEGPKSARATSFGETSIFEPLTAGATLSRSNRRVESSGQDEIELPDFLRRQAN